MHEDNHKPKLVSQINLRELNINLMSEESSKKLWGGRFSSRTNPLLEILNSSIQYDQRMWSEDIQGSKAYAHALYLAGILNEEEETAIHKGLEMVAAEWANKTFKQKPEDEDIHTANERRLKELIGEPATKLHTGRSRNDQVATDMRLWLRSKIIDLKNEIKHLVQIQVQRAKTEIGILMPGYTHLQQAQVVQWSHWLLSHTWNLKEDAERLMQIHERVNVMPLGSGAIAGNPFPINRSLLAKDLGFAKFSYNSMNAVGNRDFIAEFLSWASLVAVHLSQIAEDLIIFSSSGFGFVSLDESFSTGSSLMPQKRNPDSLELIRGKAGRIFGNHSGFLMTLKGLPSTYNKDLQEDKGALFDTYDNLKNMLAVAAGVIQTLTVNEDRCLAALSPELLATDLAYYLVRKGVPFREAHHISGEVVKLAEKLKIDISNVSVEQLKEISDKFEDNVIKVWDYRSSVEQYQAIGGTSTNSITQQIHILEQWLE